MNAALQRFKTLACVERRGEVVARRRCGMLRERHGPAERGKGMRCTNHGSRLKHPRGAGAQPRC